MPEMTVGFVIDWISATSHDNKLALTWLRKMGFETFLKDVEHPNLRGYNHTRKLEGGMVVAWHSNEKKMGIHVQFSGQALRYWYSRDLDWLQLLSDLKSSGFRTSRVDLALDLKDSGLTQAHLSKHNLLAYKGKGRTPKVLPVGTQEDGWTVYVGSRQSEKFLRIYDWSAKHDKEAGDYVRVELECKGEVARAIGWEFPLLGRSEAIRMAQTLIRDHAPFDYPNYRTALGTERVELVLPQGRVKDTYGWLLDVCAPSLAKEIEKRPSEDVLGEFWNALKRELYQRGIDAQ